MTRLTGGKNTRNGATSVRATGCKRKGLPEPCQQDNRPYCGMNFTWNDAKRQANLKKHGLDFAETSRVFAGHTLTRPDTRFSYR